MNLTREQIAIVASYWDVECKYEVAVHLDPKRYIREKIYSEGLGTVNCYTLKSFDRYHSFKLILRPLWSITEEELRELAKAIGEDNCQIETVVVDDTNDHWLEFDYKSLFQADNDCIFQVDANEDFFIHNSFIVPVINFLRAKGFCVDEEIKDFVEWKEVGK